MGKAIKIIISIIWDIANIIKIIPGIDLVVDLIGSVLSLVLWGWLGLLYLPIELLPTILKYVFPPAYVIIFVIQQFLPTMTLIGVLNILFSRNRY